MRSTSPRLRALPFASQVCSPALRSATVTIPSPDPPGMVLTINGGRLPAIRWSVMVAPHPKVPALEF